MDFRQDHFGRGTNDFVLTFPTNWTAVWFFAILGLLHLCNAVPTFFARPYEGFASLVIGCMSISASVVWWRVRCDLGVMSSQRRLRIRTRLGALRRERSIEFDEIRGIRVFSTSGQQSGDSRIEILCESEDIECPPTLIASQQALHMAMLMDVELIKVCDDDPPPTHEPAVHVN